MKEVLKYKSQLVSLVISVGVIIFTMKFVREYFLIREWMLKSFPEPRWGWPSYSDFHISFAFAMISLFSNLLLN